MYYTRRVKSWYEQPSEDRANLPHCRRNRHHTENRLAQVLLSSMKRECNQKAMTSIEKIRKHIVDNIDI